MEEIVWKKIEGFENYSVSSTLEVRNDKTGKVLTQFLRSGYLNVNLYKSANNRSKMRVHRLVALAFIPLVDGKECIDHINEIKTDNRIENLRWCTRQENLDFYWKTRPAQSYTYTYARTKPYETEEHKKERLSKRSNEMAKESGQVVYVNGTKFNAVRQAARYIVEEESKLGNTKNIETVRKEVKKFVNGTRPAWSMYGRYEISN